MTSEFWRRLAVTVAALLVYRLATHIPLYGVDMGVLLNAYGAGQIGLVERVSIGALGVIPIFTAVAIFELVRLFGPARLTARWDGKATPSWVLWLALTFAAVQAGGVAQALEAVGPQQIVATPGTGFRIATVGTLAASTALFWWLAGVMTRDGLGSGLWWMLLAQFYEELAHAPGQILELMQMGVAWAVGLPAGYLVVAVGLVVLLCTLLTRSDRGAAILWPALLAPQALSILLLPVAGLSVATNMDLLSNLPQLLYPGGTAWMIVMTGLIAVLVVVRHWRHGAPQTRGQSAILAVALLAILPGVEFLRGRATLQFIAPDPAMLIAATVVMVQLLGDIRTGRLGADGLGQDTA